MKRSEFLKLVGIGSLSAVAGVSLIPKEKEIEVPSHPEPVNEFIQKYNEALWDHKMVMEKAFLFGSKHSYKY